MEDPGPYLLGIVIYTPCYIMPGDGVLRNIELKMVKDKQVKQFKLT